MPFLVILHHISLSQAYIVINSCAECGQGHVAALATQNGLSGTQIPCYGSGWLYCSALPFVLPALEVLTEIKTKFLQYVLSPYSPIRINFHTMPFKISFILTWLIWLSHCIIFQIKKGNKLTD